MSKVHTGASMSLDGYISGPQETGFEHLFRWYGSGDVEVRTTHEDLTMRLSPVGARAGELAGDRVVGVNGGTSRSSRR